MQQMKKYDGCDALRFKIASEFRMAGGARGSVAARASRARWTRPSPIGCTEWRDVTRANQMRLAWRGDESLSAQRIIASCLIDIRTKIGFPEHSNAAVLLSGPFWARP